MFSNEEKACGALWLLPLNWTFTAPITLVALLLSGCDSGGNERPLKLTARLDGVALKCVTFMGDSHRFVSSGTSADFKLSQFAVWQVSREKPLAAFSAGARDFVLCADGTAYAINGHWRLEKWDLQAGRSLGLFYDGSDIEFQSIAMSPNGKLLIAGSGAWKPAPDKPNICDVWIWDIGAPAAPRRFTGHLAPIDGLAVSPDNKILLSASADGTFRKWNFETGEELARDGKPKAEFVYPHSFPERSPIAFSDHGAIAVHELAVWDIHRWKKLRTLGESIPRSDRRYGFEMIQDVKFVPGTMLVITAHKDGMIRLWDAETGTLLDSVAASENYSYATTVAVSADGHTVVTGANGSIPGWTARQQGVPSADQRSLRNASKITSPICYAPMMVFFLGGAGWTGMCGGSKFRW